MASNSGSERQGSDSLLSLQNLSRHNDGNDTFTYENPMGDSARSSSGTPPAAKVKMQSTPGIKGGVLKRTSFDSSTKSPVLSPKSRASEKVSVRSFKYIASRSEVVLDEDESSR
jgi:hypothetical protein